VLWHVVYIGFVVLQLLFFVRLSYMSGDKEKIDCIQLVYMPSIHLVKCCVVGSHSLGDCHILSVMYFRIMCGFSGVTCLKILVPEFLIFEECIVGKHLIWWRRVSSIARCCRRCKLCICILQQLTYICSFYSLIVLVIVVSDEWNVKVLQHVSCFIFAANRGIELVPLLPSSISVCLVCCFPFVR